MRPTAMKAYIAGPMSGIPQCNFPLFDYMTHILRNRDWEIISPAELDKPEIRAESLASKDGSAHSGKWGEFLSRDVKMIADEGVEAIFLLPGWQDSKGAKLEAFVGALLGLQFFVIPPDHITPMPHSVDVGYVLDEIRRVMQ